MGLYPQPSAPECLFGGAEVGGGGGGLAVVACTHPCGGGSPVGAPSGLAENTRWRPLGPWAPSRKNLGFAGGDSATVVHMHLYPITGGGAGGMGMGMEGGGGAAPDPQIWNGALLEPHSTGVALAASGDEII